MGFWWGAGLLIAVLIVGMLLFIRPVTLTLPKQTAQTADTQRKSIPLRVWLYAAVIFLYAFSEATFGNWGTIYLQKEAGLSVGQAALGLSIFWAAITVGRILFTFLAYH